MRKFNFDQVNASAKCLSGNGHRTTGFDARDCTVIESLGSDCFHCIRQCNIPAEIGTISECVIANIFKVITKANFLQSIQAIESIGTDDLHMGVFHGHLFQLGAAVETAEIGHGRGNGHFRKLRIIEGLVRDLLQSLAEKAGPAELRHEVPGRHRAIPSGNAVSGPDAGIGGHFRPLPLCRYPPASVH